MREFDLVVVRSSGGKDSQTAMRQVWRTAAQENYPLDRIVVEYDELNGDRPGDKVTWPGTADIGSHLVDRFGDRPGSLDLARVQAEHYGFRFLTRRQTARPPLLEDVRTRTGKDGRHRWPDARNRWCTSDHKRAVGRKLLTELVRELGLGRAAKVLTVMGFRAQESDGRARREPFMYDAGASGKGVVRQVWLWLPIHHWTEEQVWMDIHASGVPYAWPYDAGMSRFSCALCVLGSRRDAVLSARLWPENADRYLAVEREIGHTFQQGWSMADIVAAAEAPDVVPTDEQGTLW